MSRKITQHTELASGDIHDDDLIEVVDVSDTTDGAGGTNKKSKWSSFVTKLGTALASVFATAAQGSTADSAVQPGDLSGYALSSSLGTAAAEDVGYFATAAQGAKADSALQSADVGTAAAEDVGYFATAAQGALADSALQDADVGTAAAEDVGYFATAAQGAKADTALQPPGTQTESGTSYTLALTDAWSYQRLTNASSCTITLPLEATVAWPADTEIFFRIAAAGIPTFSTSATINNVAAVAAMAQHDTFAIKKVGTDVWDLI